jgi:hypothetical protein
VCGFQCEGTGSNGPAISDAPEVSGPAVSWGSILGGDPGEGLDMIGDFAYAVNVVGPGGTVVGDATFTDDQTTIGFSISAGYEIMEWGAEKDIGFTNNDQGIEFLMRSLRWESYPSKTLIDMDVTTGTTYRLQLMYHERCCVRSWDVIVNGKVIAADFSPSIVDGSTDPAAVALAATTGASAHNELATSFIDNPSTLGALLAYEFTADSPVLAIVLDGEHSTSSNRHPFVNAVTLEILPVSQTQLKMTTGTPMPSFDERPELHNQSLSLRHVRMEAQVAFGGGGTDHGAAMSLAGSTCALESVEFVGCTQRGVGAGVIFAVGSNVTASFAVFEDNRNLGLGAGVLTASAGSRVAFSHAQFLGNFADNQMGLFQKESSRNRINFGKNRMGQNNAFWNAVTGGDSGEGCDFKGTFKYAVNILGPGGFSVGDANFTKDTETAGFAVSAQYEIMNWEAPSEFGTTNNDQGLEKLTESLRFSWGASSPVTFDMDVVAGTLYRLQMGFNEKCCVSPTPP